MKIKKLKFLLSSILLFTMNNVFADGAECPPTEVIRTIGHTFSYGYEHNVDYSAWVLMTTAFSFKEHDWQTIFYLTIPDVHDPIVAISEGQKRFAQMPMRMIPERSVTPEKTSCTYTVDRYPAGLLVAETPPQFGR